jgi:hypothetical protein
LRKLKEEAMTHTAIRGSRLVCISLFLIALLVLPPASPQTLFKVPVNVIVVNATVTDKHGKPVTDLTANDFRVYEDDKLQNIQTFALEVFGQAEL